jgi:rhodanese-related sulfurtransferase
MLTPISPRDAAGLIEAGHALLVDVREAGEFAARHIPAALSRPLSLPDAGPLLCSPGVQMIFTCQTGRRTAANAGRLAALVPQGRGLVLDGGVDAWARAGLPVAGNDARLPLPLMRQVQIVAGLLVLAGVLLAITVAPAFIGLSAFVGAGLAFAGLSGWCGMARLLAVMPWNRQPA